MDLNVRYIDTGGTSSLCPTRGGKLSPNGYRQMKRHTCGLEEDRDKIAVKYQIDVGSSTVHPENPPMT